MKSALPISLLVIALLGAGCMPDVTSPHIAATLQSDESVVIVPQNAGFGALPTIPVPTNHVTVKLLKPVPDIPTSVTVLRLRPGTPNNTQLLNVIAALGLPGGTVGPNTMARQLNMQWSDGQGMTWTYTGTTRELQFVSPMAPSQPLTVSSLPPNELLLTIATGFLSDRGVDLQDYRGGGIGPDWNNWWAEESTAGRCMDTAAINQIRTESTAGATQSFPSLSSDPNTCLSTEFPSHVTVHFGALADAQDIVNSTGQTQDGMTLVLDASRQTVVSGTLQLTADPDRSDYPAKSAADVSTMLQQGGLSGATGEVDVSDYATDLLRVDDKTTDPPTTYLIPSLVASGTHTKTDGTTEPFQIVVPLISQ
ncbi:MAG: hypothetical protein WA001_04630 [Patescibacteria group bacterium]